MSVRPHSATLTQHWNVATVRPQANTTGCIVWILSALYLSIILSGKAWRINPHSMDFPTSLTIHSQSARSLLSCTTRCPISASAFKWFLPLKWHLCHFRIKAFRSTLLFPQIPLVHKFNRCLSGSFALTSEGRLPSGCLPESQLIHQQVSSLSGEKVEIVIACTKLYDVTKILRGAACSV